MLRSETHCWSKSLVWVLKAIYHQLEVIHISLEQNSHDKVRNTMLVEKLTEGYISKKPPFGNDAR